MIRVVFDANVWVSALITLRGSPAEILARWEAGEFVVAASPAILAELQQVLRYPRLQRFLSGTSAQALLQGLPKRVLWVVPTQTVTVVRDPSDNRYLECALESRAQILVTGDDDLLTLGSFREIQIVSPAGFLAWLKTR